VTRWFGGIKLGAGGLVRAYGGAAAECLRTAPRLERVETCSVEIRAGFAHLGAVHVVIDGLAAEKTEEHFDADGVTPATQPARRPARPPGRDAARCHPRPGDVAQPRLTPGLARRRADPTMQRCPNPPRRPSPV
jgi:hypothetical protein